MRNDRNKKKNVDKDSDTSSVTTHEKASSNTLSNSSMLLIDSINSVASQVVHSPKSSESASSLITSANGATPVATVSASVAHEASMPLKADLDVNASIMTSNNLVYTNNNNSNPSSTQMFFEFNTMSNTNNSNNTNENISMLSTASDASESTNRPTQLCYLKTEATTTNSCGDSCQPQAFVLNSHLDQENLASSESSSSSSSTASLCNTNHINYLNYTSLKRILSDDDFEIIEICQSLLDQTFEMTNNHLTSQSEHAFGFDFDEFTQVGIRKCVKFCMNLPGNSDLCTDDRAKLLKYGVYEIAVSLICFLSLSLSSTCKALFCW